MRERPIRRSRASLLRRANAATTARAAKRLRLDRPIRYRFAGRHQLGRRDRKPAGRQRRRVPSARRIGDDRHGVGAQFRRVAGRSASIGSLPTSTSPVSSSTPSHQVEATPSDPQYGQLWGMTAIDAPDAWNITHRQFASVVVAVIDTGVDYTASRPGRQHLDEPRRNPPATASTTTTTASSTTFTDTIL